MRALLTVVLLGLASCGASDDAAASKGGGAGGGAASRPTQAEATKMQTDPGYDGPALTAAIETMESQPPQYAVQVRVECMTGGYELAHTETKPDGAGTDVYLTLTEPGEGEMVMQMLETKELRVKLDSASGPVRVGVRRIQRGKDYAELPAFRLAATLTR